MKMFGHIQLQAEPRNCHDVRWLSKILGIDPDSQTRVRAMHREGDKAVWGSRGSPPGEQDSQLSASYFQDLHYSRCLLLGSFRSSTLDLISDTVLNQFQNPLAFWSSL